MEDFHNFQERLEMFKREHPGVRVRDILRVFHFHKGVRAKSIEEASYHVYEEPCAWCQARLREKGVVGDNVNIVCKSEKDKKEDEKK